MVSIDPRRSPSHSRCRDDALASHTPATRSMRSATSSGCSTSMLDWVMTPGISVVPSGSFRSSPHAYSCSWRGFAASKEYAPALILRMRSRRPSAPCRERAGRCRCRSSVKAHPVRGDVAQGVVESLDAHPAPPRHSEAQARLDDPVHHQTRVVDLDKEARVEIALYSSPIASAMARGTPPASCSSGCSASARRCWARPRA